MALPQTEKQLHKHQQNKNKKELKQNRSIM